MASVKPGSVKVRFSYSTDSGATWLPAGTGGDPHVEFWASEFSCTVRPEKAIEQQFEEKRKIRRVPVGRIKLMLTLAADQFGKRGDASDANLVWIENWLMKPLLRVYVHDGAGTPAGLNVDGHSYFASATNTNYIVPEFDAEADIETDFRKSHTLTLEVAEAIMP